jgi:hypothetical protein
MVDPRRRILSAGRRIDHVSDGLLSTSSDRGRHAHHQEEKTDDPHTRQSGLVSSNVMYGLTPVMVNNPSPRAKRREIAGIKKVQIRARLAKRSNPVAATIAFRRL